MRLFKLPYWTLLSLWLLAACGGQEAKQATADFSCGSEAAQAGLRQTFLRELRDQAALGLDEAELLIITTAAETLQLQATDFRTDSTDAAAKKVTCKALLKVTLPPELMKRLELAYAQNNHEAFRLKDAFGSEGNVTEVLADNQLETPVQYEAQLTDDQKTTYVSAELNGVSHTFANILTPLAGMSLSDDTPETYENDLGDPEENARDNRIAHAKLNTLWNDLPDDVLAKLKTEQRAWLVEIKQQCQAEAEQANYADDADRAQHAQLCNTRKVEHRYLMLQPHHISTSEYEAREAAAVAAAAESP